jgi:hypothetical protein
MVILVMRFEVIGKIGDPFSQDRHLHFRGPGISGLGSIVLDKLLLAQSADRHRMNSCEIDDGLSPED